MNTLPSVAQEQVDLLAELKAAEAEDAARIEREILSEWSKTGSASMDLLLKRGRDAIEVNDWGKALEHLTALTDHAPDFAEGYHSRAIAFFRLEMFGPAVADLEQALALNPQHFGAIRGLATVFEALGDARQAYAAYQLVLDLHPHDEEAQKGADRTRARALGKTL